MESWENVLRSKIAVDNKIYHFGSTKDEFFILEFQIPQENILPIEKNEPINGSSSLLERFKTFILTRVFRINTADGG
jgi:hypothetical protein